MAVKLDRFDWHYGKEHIWGMFAILSILWPAIFIRPQIFVDPTKLFQDQSNVAGRLREEARLWNKPPPCGQEIKFRQNPKLHGETFGEFTFRSIDVEAALIIKLHRSPKLVNGQEGAILNWLRQRDDSITEPTGVPDAWWRFQFIADELIRNGRGEIHCLKCNKQLSNEASLQNDTKGMPGWNFNGLACPEGHHLLVVETAHIFVG